MRGVRPPGVRRPDHVGLDLVAPRPPRPPTDGPARAAAPHPHHLAGQSLATALYDAWEAVVRASSAVENWRSVLRSHLDAYRTSRPGCWFRSPFDTQPPGQPPQPLPRPEPLAAQRSDQRTDRLAHDTGLSVRRRPHPTAGRAARPPGHLRCELSSRFEPF